MPNFPQSEKTFS